MADQQYILFCEYPLQTLKKNHLSVIGDPRLACSVRLIPLDANAVVAEDAVSIRGAKARVPSRSTEGHVIFEVHGGDVIIIKAPSRLRRKGKPRTASRRKAGPSATDR
ncbi:MAG TPA: hypothetical protein VGD50_01890, partial [Candidatus Baltobacteraceae bacterium]